MFTVSDNVPEHIIDIVKSLTDKNGNLSSIKARHIPLTVKEWFLKNQSFITIRSLFNLLKNNLNSIPVCDYCKTIQLTPKQYEKGHRYCCNKHAQLDDKTKEKVRRAFEKYDGGHPLRDTKIRQQIEQTNMQKYGASVACNSDSFKILIKNNNLLKYGVEHTSQLPEVQQKRIKTYIINSIKKYGVSNPSMNSSIKNKALLSHKLTLWNKMQNTAKENNLIILSSVEDYIAFKPFIYRCGICNKEFSSKNAPYNVRCEICYPKTEFVSNKEREVVKWVKSIYSGEILTSVRNIINPYELDIYLPENNIAIEFDGLYWHSDKFKEKTYHQKKTLLCKDKNIHLIHIPELLWNKKQEIVKSIILNALKLNTLKIFARNTICKEIDFKSYSEFLNINHIQGSVASKYRYGLFYNNELVAVFGFGKSRFNKNEQELHRYAPKIGYTIIGGFSKLLKHSKFSGTTYVDMNFFTGNGYLKNNFSFVSITEPSYIWINPSTDTYISRYQAQKHKLKNILPNFDKSLTENENMKLNGYFKIYDSGCLKLKNI